MTQIINSLIIILLFTVFGVLHSVLASSYVKRKIKARHGKAILLYRFFYNIISVMLFLLIFLFASDNSILVYELTYPYDLLIVAVRIIFLIFLFWTIIYMDLLELTGIKQIYRYIKGVYSDEDIFDKSELIIKGPYKISRHPLYFFITMLLLFSPIMDANYITFLVCTISYFWIGSIYEEKKLVEKFNSEYVEYQKSTSRIIPMKWINNKMKVAN